MTNAIELKNLDVQEIGSEEIMYLNGGISPWWFVGTAFGIGAVILVGAYVVGTFEQGKDAACN